MQIADEYVNVRYVKEVELMNIFADIIKNKYREGLNGDENKLKTNIHGVNLFACH